MQVGIRVSGRIASRWSVRDQQLLTVVRPVVYHSYGARLFTAHIAVHQ